jgi:hypothetical protein
MPHIMTEQEYNAIHADYRSVWTTDRTDLPDWEQDREKYMGKRTLLTPSGLEIEGLGLVIIPAKTVEIGGWTDVLAHLKATHAHDYLWRLANDGTANLRGMTVQVIRPGKCRWEDYAPFGILANKFGVEL